MAVVIRVGRGTESVVREGCKVGLRCEEGSVLRGEVSVSAVVESTEACGNGETWRAVGSGGLRELEDGGTRVFVGIGDSWATLIGPMKPERTTPAALRSATAERPRIGVFAATEEAGMLARIVQWALEKCAAATDPEAHAKISVCEARANRQIDLCERRSMMRETWHRIESLEAALALVAAAARRRTPGWSFVASCAACINNETTTARVAHVGPACDRLALRNYLKAAVRPNCTRVHLRDSRCVGLAAPGLARAVYVVAIPDACEGPEAADLLDVAAHAIALLRYRPPHAKAKKSIAVSAQPNTTPDRAVPEPRRRRRRSRENIAAPSEKTQPPSPEPPDVVATVDERRDVEGDKVFALKLARLVRHYRDLAEGLEDQLAEKEVTIRMLQAELRIAHKNTRRLLDVVDRRGLGEKHPVPPPAVDVVDADTKKTLDHLPTPPVLPPHSPPAAASLVSSQGDDLNNKSSGSSSSSSSMAPPVVRPQVVPSSSTTPSASKPRNQRDQPRPLVAPVLD